MKNLLAIVILLFLGIGAKAFTGGEAISYVKTSDKVYFGQDLKIGLFNSKIISSDGTVTKIPHRDVLAYMKDSRLFEYLPVICESNDTLCYAMMEYITTRSGLNLYRYDYFDGENMKSHYFLFKEGKFYLRVDKINALTVLPFFGIRNIRLSES